MTRPTPISRRDAKRPPTVRSVFRRSEMQGVRAGESAEVEALDPPEVPAEFPANGLE